MKTPKIYIIACCTTLFFSLGAITLHLLQAYNTLPSYDARVYLSLATQITNAPDITSILSRAIASSTSTHTNFFALPFALIFQGKVMDTHSMILALIIFYVFPLGIILALILKPCIPTSLPAVISGITIAIALSSRSNLWISLQLSYPDIAAIFIVSLVMLAVTRMDGRLKISRIVWLAILVACAVFYRRHMLYPLFTICLSATIASFVELLFGNRFFFHPSSTKSKMDSLPANIRSLPFYFRIIYTFSSGPLANLLTLGLGTLLGLAFLAVLFPIYMQLITMAGTSGLYSDYVRSPGLTAAFFLDGTGTIEAAAAILGYCLALVRLPTQRRTVLFLFLLGPSYAVLWVFFIRFIGVQYLLFLTCIWIPLGLSLLLFALVDMSQPLPGFFRHFRSVLVPIPFLVILVGWWVSLSGYSTNGVFQAPLRASDGVSPSINAMRAVVKRLVQRPEKSSIVFLASSRHVNAAIFYSIVDSEPGAREKLAVLSFPTIDSRDYIPMNSLLFADIVVIAQPYQFHLGEDSHRMMTATGELIRHGEFLGRNFHRLQPDYSGGGVTLEIYERIKSVTIGQAVATFDQILTGTKRRPGSQAPWAEISPRKQTKPMWSSPTQDWVYTGDQAADHDWPINYLYTFKGSGSASLSGEFRTDCKQGTVTALVVTSSGDIVSMNEVQRLHETPADEYIPIDAVLPGKPDKNEWVVLSFMSNSTIPACAIYARNLSLKWR